LKNERKAQRSQRQGRHVARRVQGNQNGKQRGEKEGERGGSRQSCLERTWGEQAEYFSASPKERQTKGERKAQSANRERRRTKRDMKDC